MPACLRPIKPSPLLLILLVGLLAPLEACSFADDTLLPSLAGEDPRGAAAIRPAPEAAPQAASTDAGVTLGGLRGDLDRLKSDVASRRQELDGLHKELEEGTATIDGLASEIESRLGTTPAPAPDDPQLSGDWSRSQAELQRMTRSAGKLNAIADWAGSDSALASYITQAAHAAAAQPGTDIATRRQFAGLETEAGRAASSVDVLLTRVSTEVASRNLFLSTVRRRLAALGPAISAGRRPGAVSPEAFAEEAPTSAGAQGEERRALVTIRFDRPDVAFEQPLYEAVHAVLDKRPNASFDIVAVSPPGPNAAAAAERGIEQVVKSLAKMGLPADRMRLKAAASPGIKTDEVRVYLR